MICPYNKKSEVTTIQWHDDPEEAENGQDGMQSGATTYMMMECQKENCAVWYDGTCHYNGRQV